MIFELRANERYEIGMPDLEEAQLYYKQPKFVGLDESVFPRFTPYIIIDHKHGAKLASTGFSSLTLTSQLQEEVTEGGDFSTAPSPLSEKTGKDVDIEELLKIFHKLGMEGPDGKLIIPEIPASDDPWKEAQRLAPITYLSLTEAAASVIVAMKKEKDWDIVRVILTGIPKMLQNKALIVSRDSNDIDYFAEALTGVVTDRSLRLPASLYNTPPKFLRPEFEVYVYVALSCLSCYKHQLSQKWRKVVSLYFFCFQIMFNV